MGVYINGIEMPTSCRACHLKMNCEDCEGLECVCVPLHQQIGYLDDLLADKRRDDCPLIPIPPHGDLIDADKLVELCDIMAEKCDGIGVSIWHQFKTTVEWSPIVIPAEEGE